MRIVLAGAHGQIAHRLGRLLAGRGDQVVGIVRNPAHEADLRDDGMEPVVLDLESASVDDVSAVLAAADVAVFAAGAGPGSGAARKDTVDRGAAVLLADAAEWAGVGRYVLVSSIGVDQVAGGATPDGMDEVFLAYLRAKLAAEENLLARDGLDVTVLRPGGLTDEPGTGQVTLAPSVERGSVPRDDVAAVLAGVLVEPRTIGKTFEVFTGDTPIEEALRRL